MSTKLSGERRLKDLNDQISALDHEAIRAHDAAEDLVATYKNRNIDPLKNEDAFAQVDEAYTRADVAKARAKRLREEANDVAGTLLSGGRGLSRDDVALTKDQSVAEWASVRGQGGDELSLGRLVRGMVTGEWDGARAEMAALSEGQLSEGGALVPAPLSASLIDLARAKSRCVQAGAQTVPMTSQTLAIARITGDAEASWRAENSPVAESAPTFDRVTFEAKSLATIVKSSRELFEDAVNLDQALTQSLSSALALELDRVCLYGSGATNEPTGVALTDGIDIWDHDNMTIAGIPGVFLDSVERLWMLNEEPTGIVLPPTLEMSIARQTDANGQPLQMPTVLAELPRYRTNQVVSTGGSNENEHDWFTADWTQLLIGMRTELRIELLRERYADNLQVAFLAHLRADVQLARPSAFSFDTGAALPVGSILP